MSDDKKVSEHMIQSRPRLHIDTAFTARVMEDVRETKQRRFIAWRKWAAVAAAAVVVFAGGAALATHQHSDQVATKSTPTSGASTSQSVVDTTSAAYYQQLASSAQSDVNAISQQTGNLSDTDYADTQLADGVVF